MDQGIGGKLPLKNKWKRVLFLVLLFLVIAVFLRTFIFVLTPFFLALVIATIIDRPVSILSRKMPRIIAVIIVLSVLFLILTITIIFVVSSLIYELIYLSSFLPEYREQIVETINQALQFFQDFFDALPVEIVNILDRNLIQRGEEILSSTISNIIEGTVNFTINLPALVIFFVFMVIASFFLSKDKEKMINYIKEKTTITSSQLTNIIHDVLSYIKAQLLIMGNTTILTGITFYFLDFPYAIILALSCGILDLIPVVGPGGILWPLIIYYLFVSPGFSLLFFILYVIVAGSRPMIESKVIGSNIGLHPVILLLGLYIGFITLGLQGIILAPLSLIVFKAFLNNDLV